MELRSSNQLHFNKTAKMLSSFSVLTVKVPESSGIDCGNGDERRGSDLEGMRLGNMTLKQIKERCKGKKRKCSTNPKLKQDYFNIQVEEDEHDLTMPLRCWKSKTSKKKAKRKSMKNCSSTLLRDIESTVKGISAPTDIKVTVSASDYSHGQDTICVAVDSSFGCNGSYEVEIPKLDRIEAQSAICVAGDSSVDCSVDEVPESDSSIAQIMIHHAEDCDENVGCSVVEIPVSDYSDAQIISIPLDTFSMSFDYDPCTRSDSSASIGNDLPMAEEEQPLLLKVSDEPRDSQQLNPSAVTDALEGSPGNMFSARKFISPTSRKRLCNALESDGSCHIEPHRCYGDPDQIRTESAMLITSQKTKKPKDGEKGLPPKRKVKVSLPSLSSGCGSVQICSESAIAFSQQQMCDIERIATRLTEELRTMKDIVEERLCSQNSPTKSPKYNADEVRIAISDAKKAEEATQRWLTMMSKDCKRFCKIMSLTEKGSVAYTSAVMKRRKRIKFADEAGGELCHVKIFNDDMASVEEHKPELLLAA